MKKTITCRPCKEQNNWEIKDQNGNVLMNIMKLRKHVYVLVKN